MRPAGKLAPQPWMTSPATQRVLTALTAEGAEVRFVGGCVRDAVLGRIVKDIDIATHDAPETVMSLLIAASITAIPTGIEHGTITAVIGKDHFEITTLREDVETFGRRARVAFTDDWAADAARRDLTINALFAAPDGTLYDPFDGLDDLKAGRIRFVGDARARIEEDVLRLLRFFRFYAHYGKPPLDDEARRACRELAPLLPKLSGERVAAESLKLLAAPEPASIVALMIEDGIVAHFFPEAIGVEVLRALVTVEGIAASADAHRRLAALIDPAMGAEAVTSLADRWHLSNAERERLTALAAPDGTLRVEREMSVRHRRLSLFRLGADQFRDLALLAWAREIASSGPTSRHAVEAWRDHLGAADRWTPIALPIKGRDVLVLGVSAGPRVGELLAAVELWWIEEDFQPGREACLDKLAALAGA